ncbi:MAG: RHS repeat-associated core domain-containing protein [Deltaproteobacteria bacterium]|nr:RHS repeat-associated core domain-containing protein [Deltaproteobacteria bacterium]
MRLVYPSEEYTSQFTAGWCLWGDNGNGVCLQREKKATTIELDTQNGVITRKVSTDYGDSQVTYDDRREITEYERIGAGNIVKKTKSKTHQFNPGTGNIDKPAAIESYDYWPNGNLRQEAKWNDVDNNWLTLGYTQYPNGLPETTTDIENHVTRFDYDFDTVSIDGTRCALQKTTTSPDGTITREQYDYQNHLVQSSINDGAVEFFSYDYMGRPDAKGNHIAGGMHIRYNYFSNSRDGRGFFGVKVTGQQAGQPIEIYHTVDATGRLGQTLKRATVGGVEQWIRAGQTSYDSADRIRAKGKPVVLDLTIDPEQYHYLSGTDPELLEEVSYEYDPQGRVQRITDIDGKFQQFMYSTVPGLSSTNGSRYNQTIFLQYVEDHSGEPNGGQIVSKLRTVKDIHGNTLEETHISANGEMLTTQKIIHSMNEMEILDPQLKSSTYTLDSLGRLIRINTPDAGETVYAYKANGKLETVTRYGRNPGAESSTTAYYYDTFGRIEYVDNEDNERDVKFTYCGPFANVWSRNKVCSIAVGFNDVANVENADLTTSFEYGKDYVTKWRHIIPKGGGSGNFGPSAAMTYYSDAYGRTSAIKYPDGEMVNYSYDVAGRLHSIVGDVPYIGGITYNKENLREFITSGNGISRKYEYDSASNQLRNMRVYNSKFNPYGTLEDLLNLTYTYDNRRLLDTVENDKDKVNTENHFVLDYSYDSFGRIAGAHGSADSGDWSLTNAYNFDDGTRLESSFVSGQSRITTDIVPNSSAPANVKITETGEQIQYRYNNFGELTNIDKTVGGILEDSESKEFDFNSDGTLANAYTADTYVRFNYDAFGNRVFKRAYVTGGVLNETMYLFNLYSRKNGAANNHISDGRHVVATKLRGDESKVLFYTPDHLGSTVLVTNFAAQVLSKAMYDPFGNAIFEQSMNGGADNDRKFTNQIYDEETGLYYFNARYYDPKNGVFISPDPAMDGLNHYVYAKGNPLIFTDLTGLYEDFSADYFSSGWEDVTVNIPDYSFELPDYSVDYSSYSSMNASESDFWQESVYDATAGAASNGTLSTASTHVSNGYKQQTASANGNNTHFQVSTGVGGAVLAPVFGAGGFGGSGGFGWGISFSLSSPLDVQLFSYQRVAGVAGAGGYLGGGIELGAGFSEGPLPYDNVSLSHHTEVNIGLERAGGGSLDLDSSIFYKDSISLSDIDIGFAQGRWGAGVGLMVATGIQETHISASPTLGEILEFYHD